MFEWGCTISFINFLHSLLSAKLFHLETTIMRSGLFAVGCRAACVHMLKFLALKNKLIVAEWLAVVVL